MPPDPQDEGGNGWHHDSLLHRQQLRSSGTAAADDLKPRKQDRRADGRTVCHRAVAFAPCGEQS
jgi:hypothetical protein